MTDGRVERLSAALADRYRIERELGQGGMATVYLARDLRHDRDVAIKVLHPELAAALGSERFLSEIKTTAKLQHPHILPLLDSGQADGQSSLYYVMPYVTGETLRARLERERQLPIEDAIRIAREVADALGSAHALGIIHRDIKPENILLQGGHALVADFGIALAVQSAAGQRMTQTGLSLGTPQYMSPEQAMGEKTIDARADLYALGAVTYEMLTGDAPFTGSTVQAIVAQVLTEEPRGITAQRKAVPAHVEAAVLQALEKLPADRPANAALFSQLLEGVAVASRNRRAGAGRASSHRPATRAPMLLGVLALVSAGIAAWALLRPTPAAPARSTSIVLPDSLALDPLSNTPEGLPTIAISPDGSQLVFAALRGNRAQLFVRRMSDFSVRALEGTEGASAPFFSPDGGAVGFFAGPALKRVSLADGQVRTLSPNMVDNWGGAWLPDGNLVVSRRRATELLVLGANGDSLRGFQCNICSFPEPLPDGRRAIVKGRTGLHLVDLASGADTPLLRWEATNSRELLRGTMARLDGDGHLVYVGPGGQIFVAPFDAKRGVVTGASLSLAEGVRVESGRGAAQFALARSGVLAWAPGAVASEGELVRADRTGKLDTLRVPVANYNAIDITPDGRRLVVRVGTVTGDMALEIIDVETGKVTPWLSGASFDGPKWTPDGRRVLFSRDSGTFIADPETSDPPRVLRIPAGAEEVTPMADSTSYRAWLNNGMVILHTDGRPMERVLNQIPVGGSTPDNRWLMSEETDASETAIVARSLDGSGRRLVIASDSRFSMVGWAAGGNEFIMAGRSRNDTGPGRVLQGFYAVRYDPSVRDRPFSEPRLLFAAEVADFPGRNYAVGMGGNRFVFKQRVAAPPLREVRLLSNWHRQLESRARP